jgi:hypothetical protein
MPLPLLVLVRQLGHADRATVPPRALPGAVTASCARAAPRLVGRPGRFGQWAEPAGQSLGGCLGTVVVGRRPGGL